METRFQRIFLASVTAIAFCFSAVSFAQNDDPLDAVIAPDIERRHIKEDMIDSENFEFGIFAGILSIEDFGSSEVAGVTFAYHITENFFLESAYGVSLAQKTSYELLSGSVELLSDDARDYFYYNASLGYNFFPGQAYIGKNWAFNTAFYIMAGVGNTEFAENQYFTYNVGAGYRFYGTDWFSLDLSMRDHVFEHELFGRTKQVNNLEARIGMSIYF